MLKFLKDLPANTDKLDKMLTLEQQFFLPDHNLIYTDRMSMAVGDLDHADPYSERLLFDNLAQLEAR